MRLVLIGLVAVVACGDDDGPDVGVDAGGDVGVDSATDVGDDVGEDAGPGDVIATVDQGMLEGFVDPNGVATFFGIPYAAPPVESLRFRPPGDPIAWDGVRDATTPRPGCAQPDAGTGEGPGQEDCLFLQVWSPVFGTDDSRPVMLFIHGGAYSAGAGSWRLFDAAKLAADTGNVAVNINYRLGALGGLAHSALTAERGASGNYGFMDQQAALRWVRDNIEVFGGDPTRVMIYGESAGGNSVCLHLTAPDSAGLFHRAVSQSGVCGIRLAVLAEAETRGATMAESLGCDGTEDAIRTCLRAASVEELVELEPSFEVPGGLLYRDPPLPFAPILDGSTFTEDPIDAIRAGRGHEVEVIAGSNADEGTLFHIAFNSGVVETNEQVMAALVANYGSEGAALWVASNPLDGFGSPLEAMLQITGDMFTCNARRHVRELVAAGYDAYLYHLTRPPNALGDSTWRAYHGADVVWLLDPRPGPNGRVAPDFEFSSDMRGYWARFAETGDPNGGDVAWPLYTGESDEHLELNIPITVGRGLRETRCDVFDAVFDASGDWF